MIINGILNRLLILLCFVVWFNYMETWRITWDLERLKKNINASEFQHSFFPSDPILKCISCLALKGKRKKENKKNDDTMIENKFISRLCLCLKKISKEWIQYSSMIKKINII